MNRLTKQVLIGSMFAFGLALTPAMAQHEGHGMRHAATEMSAGAKVAKCPVSGEPINLATSIATDDGPVFFCCNGCIKKYQANPAKFAANVAAQRKSLADRPKVQVTCPVTHEPVDPKVFVESNGQKVYFCCKGCVKKYQADPKKYASALANSYTYQTKCPVMGEEIDPKAFATSANGNHVYFCCKGCDKKFLKNPEKYVPNLVAQGYTFDAKEMMHAEHDSGHH